MSRCPRSPILQPASRATRPRPGSIAPDNLVARWTVKYGDVDAAFAAAAHRVARWVQLDKGGGHSIEARGVLARFDPIEDRLTVWDRPRCRTRPSASRAMRSRLREDQVRVIAPDVGGGFGPKKVFYPEELVVPAAARLLNAPIKWIEDRLESFTATNHERVQDWDVEAAISAQGKLLAIRGHLRHDHGAITPSGVSTAVQRDHQPARPLRAARARARRLGLPHQHGSRRRRRAAPAGRRARS